MKNRTTPLLLFLILCLGNARAQFPNFPDSNALWLMDVYGQSGFIDEYGYHMKSTNHDTLVNGTLYNSLWAGAEGQAGAFAGGIREDAQQRVYYYHPNTDNEYLLFDFDPTIGDVLEVWIGDAQMTTYIPQLIHVISIEQVENSEGVLYKVIGILNNVHYDQGGAEAAEFWIQGVGGSGGLLSTYGLYFYPMHSTYLTCMQHNDALWPEGALGICSPLGVPVRFKGVVRIYPNPSTGHLTMEFTDPLLAESYYSVYDAVGRLLYQRPLPSGATLQEVDLSRFGPGTYVLRVTDPVGQRHERLVVE